MIQIPNGVRSYVTHLQLERICTLDSEFLKQISKERDRNSSWRLPDSERTGFSLESHVPDLPRDVRLLQCAEMASGSDDDTQPQEGLLELSSDENVERHHN
jgi:hypothetical protein